MMNHDTGAKKKILILNLNDIRLNIIIIQRLIKVSQDPKTLFSLPIVFIF